jgi:hypothetical protein
VRVSLGQAPVIGVAVATRSVIPGYVSRRDGSRCVQGISTSTDSAEPVIARNLQERRSIDIFHGSVVELGLLLIDPYGRQFGRELVRYDDGLRVPARNDLDRRHKYQNVAVSTLKGDREFSG